MQIARLTENEPDLASSPEANATIAAAVAAGVRDFDTKRWGRLARYLDENGGWVFAGYGKL
eukprot:COSAG02_NODE_39072_length_421_cov_1.018634_1_plen_61_part_00